MSAWGSLWAGASGSLLLWLWLQVNLTAIVFGKSTGQEWRFESCVRLVSNIVCCFFLVVLVFDKNVFSISLYELADGLGLNPLLQHPTMVLHPPTLFVG